MGGWSSRGPLQGQHANPMQEARSRLVWYFRTSCSTLHLIVFTHSSSSSSQLSDLQWPGTIIFGSSKEFGPLGPDGWAGLDRCQIRTTLSTLCPCRRWEEC
jgi:hypothetical protein